MRTLILKDSTIPQDEFEEVIHQVSEIYKTYADVTLDITVETRYWERLPFTEYAPGNRGVAWGMLDAVAYDTTHRFGKNVDQIVVMVDNENWVPVKDNIWGWNISAGVRGYEIQQVRFDTQRETPAVRIANSVGTLFHEMMHSHDGFIYRMTGVRIAPLVNVPDWDEDVVHGRSPDFPYIRHKENAETLGLFKVHLQDAIARRRRQHNDGTPFTEKVSEGFREGILKLTKPFAVN